MREETTPLRFRPRARLLQLLGDELIADHRIAVFELVKNAYDADSPDVEVRFEKIEDPQNARLIITDHGEGMDEAILENVWLQPGADHRKKMREAGVRTPKYSRLPTGEKGIGRFAAHKLGDKIRVETKKRGESKACNLEIDWPTVLEFDYLDEAEVEVKRISSDVFKQKSSHGTQITIEKLRNRWTRGETRRLLRAINAMTSPFSSEDEFRPRMVFVPDPGWTKDVPDGPSLNRMALFRMDFRIDDDGLEYQYKFVPTRKLKNLLPTLEGRTVRKSAAKRYDFFAREPEESDSRKKKDRVADVSLGDLGVGPISGKFLGFDRDRKVLDAMGLGDELKKYLDEQGGVKVYRDGLRVHDYGERNTDWLQLDAKRVQTPVERIGNNVILGAVAISLEHSTALIEKTNREGFTETASFREFRHAVLTAVSVFERERNSDKKLIRDALKAQKHDAEKRVTTGPLIALERLKNRLISESVSERTIEEFDRFDGVYRKTHATLLESVGSGMSLALVFHEVERGIRSVERALKNPEPDIDRCREMMSHLSELLKGAATLLQNSSATPKPASKLVEDALRLARARFRYHRVELVNGFDSKDGRAADFSVSGHPRLVIASLTNLLDNAIYWVVEGNPGRKNARRIWIGPAVFGDDHGLVVADNGPGLGAPPDEVVQPFFSMKPEGMGIGLYFVSLVVNSVGGTLRFLAPEDGAAPSNYSGARVAMFFGKEKV